MKEEIKERLFYSAVLLYLKHKEQKEIIRINERIRGYIDGFSIEINGGGNGRLGIRVSSCITSDGIDKFLSDFHTFADENIEKIVIKARESKK
ncbi:MAG: hypothetical protein QW199_00345 [Candidatus Pacearchaeota archaeon]